jgi:hypothetical protein
LFGSQILRSNLGDQHLMRLAEPWQGLSWSVLITRREQPFHDIPTTDLARNAQSRESSQVLDTPCKML